MIHLTPNPATRRHPLRGFRGGFTLIELLVVLAVMAAVLALSYPMVGNMLESNRISAASNAISLASETSRRLAISKEYGVGIPVTARYDGVAMIITPSGEVRIAENDLTAEDSGGAFLEEKIPVWNGFRDVEGFDYVELPAGADVYGINRDGGTLRFMPPPFAVRYDETGRLITGSDTGAATPASVDRLVFYDHDHDGDYEHESIGDFGGYDSDPAGASYWKNTPAPAWDTTEEKYLLPFGTFVSVPGVRIVQAGEDPENPVTNYIDLFFSRYSGTPSVINRTP